MKPYESITAYKKLYAYIKPYRWRTALAIVSTLPLGTLDAACAWALRPYMDLVAVQRNEEISQLIPLLVVAFIVLQGVLNYFSSYLNAWVGQKISMNLKLNLLKKLLYCDTVFFDKSTSGDIMFRYNSDVDLACAGLISSIRFFTIRVVSSLALIGVLFYNSVILAVIALAVLLIAIYPLTRIREKLQAALDTSIFTTSSVITGFTEVINGNRVISAYNLQQHIIDKLSGVMENCFKVSLDLVRRTSGLSLFAHAAIALGIAATILLQDYLISINKLTPGNFVSFIAALIMLYKPIKSLGNNASSITFATMALQRVFASMEASPLIQSKPNAIQVDAFRTAIVYENVHFAYTPEQPVLQGINLEIKCGQKIALVGPSGGGKSTLINLLPRFYDVTAGRITIDGVDVRDIALPSLRNLISFVLQDNFLFSGTLLENIALGKKDASREEVMEAVKAACLEEFVASLPLGLDTQIGERGILLSGGQKQRVAIARAFIRKSPIVILDEATSSLDNTSEAVVQDAIENLMQNRTILTVAHRLTTIIQADTIMVVNDGKIVESGTHENLLMNEDGMYRCLYENQFLTPNP